MKRTVSLSPATNTLHWLFIASIKITSDWRWDLLSCALSLSLSLPLSFFIMSLSHSSAFPFSPVFSYYLLYIRFFCEHCTPVLSLWSFLLCLFVTAVLWMTHSPSPSLCLLSLLLLFVSLQAWNPFSVGKTVALTPSSRLEVAGCSLVLLQGELLLK